LSFTHFSSSRVHVVGTSIDKIGDAQICSGQDGVELHGANGNEVLRWKQWFEGMAIEVCHQFD